MDAKHASGYAPRHARPWALHPAFFAVFLLCYLAWRWCMNILEYVPYEPIPMHAASGNPAYLIRAEHGAVSSENKRCSDVGVDVLKEGGNALDAAVSAILCLGVVNMFSSGIGGGGFMTVRIPNAQDGSEDVFTVNFREKAPASSNETMFVPPSNNSMFGGLSSGVPGELRGLEEAHRRWGVLPWNRLVQPSVDLAAGWTVDRELGKRLTWFPTLMLENPDWSPIFAPNGVLLKEGDFIQRTNLSKTLAAIAEHGADAFYKGPVADSVIKKIQDTGGIVTQEDFNAYEVKVERALKGSFMGKNVYTMGPPSSGPVLLHMLNVMELYNMTKRDGLETHRLVEIMKFAFAARTRLCDPGYHNDTKMMAEISTKEFAEEVWGNITDDRTHSPKYYHPLFDIKDDHGTSHTTTIDKDGMVVSITTTVNFVFGSQVLDPVTGVILNDEMFDFSIPGSPNAFGLWPSPYNYPQPRKQPLSSMAPTIITDDRSPFILALGGSGGSRIFGAVFQTILNVMLFGEDISSAIEFERVHNQLYPEVVSIEENFPSDLIEALEEKGHTILMLPDDSVESVIQGVHRVGAKTIFAAADSRKNGIAAGY